MVVGDIKVYLKQRSDVDIYMNSAAELILLGLALSEVSIVCGHTTPASTGCTFLKMELVYVNFRNKNACLPAVLPFCGWPCERLTR